MDTLVRFFIFFLFIFFLFNNAKADKSVNEEEIFSTNDSTIETQYNYDLDGK